MKNSRLKLDELAQEMAIFNASIAMYFIAEKKEVDKKSVYAIHDKINHWIKTINKIILDSRPTGLD